MLRKRLLTQGEAIVLIALGGALGANLRFALGAIAGEALATTAAVNAVGCFGLGLLLFEARADELLSKRFRYIFATGFFASFTTYSTFIADIALTTPSVALVYITASYAAGFGGVFASYRVVSAVSNEPIQLSAEGER